jgi:hypothetical protein
MTLEEIKRRMLDSEHMCLASTLAHHRESIKMFEEQIALEREAMRLVEARYAEREQFINSATCIGDLLRTHQEQIKRVVAND